MTARSRNRFQQLHRSTPERRALPNNPAPATVSFTASWRRAPCVIRPLFVAVGCTVRTFWSAYPSTDVTVLGRSAAVGGGVDMRCESVCRSVGGASETMATE